MPFHPPSLPPSLPPSIPPPSRFQESKAANAMSVSSTTICSSFSLTKHQGSPAFPPSPPPSYPPSHSDPVQVLLRPSTSSGALSKEDEGEEGREGGRVETPWNPQPPPQVRKGGREGGRERGREDRKEHGRWEVVSIFIVMNDFSSHPPSLPPSVPPSLPPCFCLPFSDHSTSLPTSASAVGGKWREDGDGRVALFARRPGLVGREGGRDDWREGGKKGREGGREGC